MPPKRQQGKQAKKQSAAQERVRQQQEAQKRSDRDKADHSFLDAEIAAREKVAADEKEELERKMAVTLHIQNNFLPKFRQMPKVELHAHLSGSLSRRSIEFIMEHDLERSRDILSKYNLKQPSDMGKLFDVFPIIHEVLEKPEAVKIATREMIREFAEDGCVYLEIRTGPKDTPFMNKELHLRTVVEAIEEAKVSMPQIKVFLIVSFNRELSYKQGVDLLHLIGLFQQKTDVIVGIELSGNPDVNASHLVQLFQLARRFHGLGISVHLAEVEHQLADVMDYLMILPDRIGHGTFLHTNPKFVEMMTFYKIPLEICLSSNIYSKTAKTLHDSHFAYWRRLGVPVTINTDDKGVIPGASLTEEYYKATVAFSLTDRDLIQINMDAMKASFAFKYNVTDLRDVWRKIEQNSFI